MHIVLLDEMLQLLVLTAHLLLTLRVQALLREVYEYTPAPVLIVTRFVTILHLNADQAARHQERYNVLWLAHNFTNLFPKAFLLLLKLLLSSDEFLLWDGAQVLELLKLIREFSFDFWKDALVLELVEALHNDILRDDVLNSHHVQQHVVPQMETRVQWVRLTLEYVLGHLRL